MIKSSNLLIIGASVSSIFPILLSNEKVTVIEKGKLFSRILISGNGRCNFFNENILKDNDINKILLTEKEKSYPLNVLNYIINDLDISYYKDNDLYYPFFNRSECFYNPLIEKISKTDTEFIKGEAININPIKKEVTYNSNNKKEIIKYNKLLVTTGGFSYLYKQDYSLLNSLNIKINNFSPCLCPIVVKEKIPSFLTGLRIRGKVSLLINNKEEYFEEGEVLFKKDGLSGIAIFNMSLKINEYLRKNIKDIKLVIDYSSYNGFKNTSISSLPNQLISYLKEKKLNVNEKLTFTFSKLYPFKEAQTSFGGISIDEINMSNLSLKKYKDIYVAGEVIDLNFKCGGYNIGYNMIEGYKIIKDILKC